MPEICRFYGIVIAMFYNEHNPPHFHAKYGEHKASIRIDDYTVIDGYLPPRALSLVVEWANKYRDELLADWDAARANLPLNSINPLK